MPVRHLLVFGLAMAAVFAASPTLPSRSSPSTTFNVRDYGAQGDGVTDDSAAIQRAADAAAATGGGTVYLPAGSYRTYAAHLVAPDVGGSIQLRDGVTLRGDGPGRTMIVGTHAGIHPIAAAGATGITVEDLEISGTAPEVDGIKFYGCDHVLVKDVVVHDLYEGVALYGARWSRIEDCVAYACSNVGFDTGEPALGVQQGAGNLIVRCLAYRDAYGFRCGGYPPGSQPPLVSSRANGSHWIGCVARENQVGFFPSYAQDLAYTRCSATLNSTGDWVLWGVVGATLNRCIGKITTNSTPAVTDVYGPSGGLVVDGRWTPTLTLADALPTF
jgi:hypothetical protein